MYSRNAKKCSWCLSLKGRENKTAGTTFTTAIFHLHHLLFSTYSHPTSTPIAKMAAPLKDCVIALSGKFDETHGKQRILAILRCFILCPKSQQGIFRILTSLRCKAKIATLIKKNGGKHSTKISGDDEEWWVTHLITTTKHIEAQAEKGE